MFVTFWSYLFRVQLVRHFWPFFCNYVCKCVKTDPRSEGFEVLKIGQNPASTLLGCLGEPMATKRYQMGILGRSGGTFGITLKPLWGVFSLYFEVFVEGFFDAF